MEKSIFCGRNSLSNCFEWGGLYSFFWVVLLFCVLGSPTCALGQTKVPAVDSLLRMWGDKNQADSMRAKVLEEACWKLINANKLLDTVVQLASKGYQLTQENGDRTNMVRFLHTKGMAYYLKQSYPSAIATLKQACEKEHKHPHQIISIHLRNLMANCYLALGDFAQTIEYYNQALEIAEQLNERSLSPIIRGNIGLVYLGIKDFEKARSYLFPQIVHLRANKDHIGEARMLLNIGRSYFDEGDYHQSLKYFELGHTLMQKIGYRDFLGAALVNIGENHLVLGDTAKAGLYFRDGLGFAVPMGKKEATARALLGLGQVYKTSRADSAIHWGQKSLEISQSLGTHRTTVKAAKLLAELHESKGQYNTALSMYKLYKSAEDSIYSDENFKSVYRTEANYALKKKQLEAQLFREKTNARMERQKWLLLFALAGILGIGGLAFTFYQNYQFKKRALSELAQAHSTLSKEQQKLQQSNARLRRFGSIVSHDILSNLDLILSTGNVLVGARPNPQSLNQYYTMTQTTSRQLKDYCLGLLADARSAQQEGLAPEEWADPMPILHRVLARFGPELRAASVELDLQELSPAPLSATLMEQVFQNLVSNTLRHGATAPQARLVIREDTDLQGRVRWIIEDNGPGIAPERRELIFGPMQKGSGPGQQVGLSLLRAALREQGADIRVESAAKSGACWIVAMP